MGDALHPYVSDLLACWPVDAGASREVDGTFMFADVSGFTALSETLGQRGREGAELLSRTLSTIFDALIRAARDHGGDVLAFGGDAILVSFAGDDSTLEAIRAGTRMQEALSEPIEVEGLGPVSLAVSIGVHAGSAVALRVPIGPQVEAVVVGPTITRTLRAEGSALAGEILATHAAADRLPATWRRDHRPSGVLVRSPSPIIEPASSPRPPALVPAERLLAPDIARIAGTVEETGLHRRVAVGFVRLTRMDQTVAERGAAPARERLGEVANVLFEECVRTGARVLHADSYPDAVKLLLCAGAPVATDANEEALLEAMHRASRRLRGMDVHMGAHRGLSFAGALGGPTRRGYTLLGNTVNLAARLMERADPGELLASHGIVSRTEVGRTELPPFRVKGRRRPVRAYRVEAGHGDRAVADLPLVGRTVEAERLDDLARRARGGTFVGVDVVGSAGLGKSRLLREVVNRNPELEPIVGRATAYAASSPYGLARRLVRVLLRIPRQLPSDEAGSWLREIVEAVAPELLGELPLLAMAIDATVDVTSSDLPSDPAIVQRRIARALAHLLIAVRAAPMLVVVDDAQWLDDATVQVLRRLAIDATTSPWMVVAAHRPDSTPVFTGLEGGSRIELEPLGADDAEALVRTAAGQRRLFDEDVEAVVRRARGNSLFLVEYARLGDGDVPDDVEALIARRMDRIEPAQRRLLGIAAVVGTTVEIEVASRASEVVDGSRPDAEHWLAMPDFLVPERAGVLTWREPVFREASYAALPFERRRQLHQAVFRIVTSGPSDGSLARSVALATHADRGGMAVEALDLLRRSGERASMEGASVDAFHLLTRAVHWADQLSDLVDAQARTALLESHADVAERAGRLPDAVGSLMRALDVSQQDSMTVRLLSSISRVHMNMGNLAEAKGALSRAAALLDQGGRDREEERARLLLGEASIAYRVGDLDRAFEQIAEVVRIDPARVPLPVRARAFLVGDGIAAEGPRRDWTVGRSLPLYEALGDDYGVGASHNNMGIVAYREGDWGRALHHWQESVRAHRRGGTMADAMTTTVNIAEIRSDQGDWERSLAVFARARESWEAGSFGLGIAFAGSLTGRTLARLGRVDEAISELDSAAERLEEIGVTSLLLAARLRRVEALWLAGDATGAGELLGALEETAAATDLAGVARLLSAAIARDQQRPDAGRRLEEALGALRAHERWFEHLLGHVLRVQLEGLDPRGDPEVQALAQRLGVWRVATSAGVVHVGRPPE